MAVQTTVTSQCFPTLMENVMNRHGFNVKAPQIRHGAFTHITPPFLFQLLMVLVVNLMTGWVQWVVGKCTGINIKPRRPNLTFWSKTAQWKESFSKHLWFAFVLVFLAEMGRIPCCGRPESSSSNI